MPGRRTKSAFSTQAGSTPDASAAPLASLPPRFSGSSLKSRTSGGAATPLSHLSRFLKYFISIGLMGLFLYWAFEGIDSRSLWDAIAGISPVWLAVLVLTMLVTVPLRAWRWRVLLRPFASDITMWDASIALAIMYAANVVVPRSGEAVRALSLNWARGAKISSVLGTVVVERTLDMIGLVVLIGMALLILPGPIEAEYPWMATLTLWVLVGCILFLAVLVMVSRHRERTIGVVEKILGPISARLCGIVCRLLEAFVEGLAALNTPSAYVEIIASSILLNAGYVFIIYESYLAFGFQQPPHSLGLPSALVVMAISSLGVVIPTPGGVGTYHFFFGESLHILFAIPAATAMACATVVHAVATITYLCIGGPAFFLQRARHARRIRSENPPGKDPDDPASQVESR